MSFWAWFVFGGLFLAAFVAASIYALAGPTPIGYVNLLWSPHDIVLELNPKLGFVNVLREELAVMRDEFQSLRAIALRPRSAYRSADYPGAVKDDSATVGWPGAALAQSRMMPSHTLTCIYSRAIKRATPTADRLGHLVPARGQC